MAGHTHNQPSTSSAGIGLSSPPDTPRDYEIIQIRHRAREAHDAFWRRVSEEAFAERALTGTFADVHGR